MPESSSFKELKDVRPVVREDAAAARILRDRIVTSDPGVACDPGASSGSARRVGLPRIARLGLVGLAGTALIAAAFAFAPAGPAGSPGVFPSPAPAYAAVHQAVAKTFASVESGTIVTRTDARWLDGRDELGLATTLKWNGKDISLVLEGEDGGQSLYVDGRYYETGNGKLVHYPDSDNGQDPRVGPVWVAAAERDVDGKRIARVVDVLKDLVSAPQADGSTVYVGHSTVGEIDAQYRDAEGLPYISRPFMKVGDPGTTVKVSITVGADGAIETWTAAYNWDNADWVYTAEYRDLGSTGKIPAPDPADVVEWDGTRG
jgi:hypothetical protein